MLLDGPYEHWGKAAVSQACWMKVLSSMLLLASALSCSAVYSWAPCFHRTAPALPLLERAHRHSRKDL